MSFKSIIFRDGKIEFKVQFLEMVKKNLRRFKEMIKKEQLPVHSNGNPLATRSCLVLTFFSFCL